MRSIRDPTVEGRSCNSMFCSGSLAAPAHWFTQWEESPMPWIRRLRVKLMGVPGGNPDLYRRRSPITYAQAFDAPVLIMHGDDDSG